MTNVSRYSTLFLLLTGILFLSTEHCYGADSALGEMGSYFRMLWGLLIVLGIILIIYGILKKRVSLFHSSASQSIKIIEIKPLMAKKALCLVEVRGEEYLLGISNDQITHIATIPLEKKSSFAETLDNIDS